jgi:hypothetical protein
MCQLYDINMNREIDQVHLSICTVQSEHTDQPRELAIMVSVINSEMRCSKKHESNKTISGEWNASCPLIANLFIIGIQ